MKALKHTVCLHQRTVKWNIYVLWFELWGSHFDLACWCQEIQLFENFHRGTRYVLGTPCNSVTLKILFYCNYGCCKLQLAHAADPQTFNLQDTGEKIRQIYMAHTTAVQMVLVSTSAATNHHLQFLFSLKQFLFSLWPQNLFFHYYYNSQISHSFWFVPRNYIWHHHLLTLQ